MSDEDTGCVFCHEPKASDSDDFCPTHKAQQDAYHHRSNMQQTWHVWINQRQEERRALGLTHEHSLYEFKDAIEELGRLPTWLRRARTGTLPTTHRQCSHQPAEPIVNNRVLCALGKNVTECSILASLYASVAKQAENRFYADMTPDAVDELAARTCVWHIFTTKLTEQHWLDTSEGYVQDEGDRMFWGNLYDNMDSSVEAEP